MSLPQIQKAKRWVEPRQVEVPAALLHSVGGHPLVSKVLVRRGQADPLAARAFLDPNFYASSPPAELPGLEAAVRRITTALQRREKLCVWGDFDVDGQTATALLVSVLADLGGSVTYHIPIRESESHGVNLPVLKEILQQGAKLLLTCDTGSAAHEAVAFAQSQGVEVVITDHHDLPTRLPPAHALVNPKLLPDSHPLATLPGVGVAFKLAERLYKLHERAGAEEAYLDLVALGIVADLALQRGEVRYLLQRGLTALRDSQRSGLQAMLEFAELDPAHLTEEHIAYLLAPRLNALGRLADANLAVEFLTTTDLSRARILASQLEGLNARRKLLTDQVFQAALSQIERDPSLLDQAALVLSHPTWPAGVIGIVASRLVEHFHRPVVLLSAPAGELARGSARSVEGCNITAAIAAQGEMLAGFGGHPMAGGLSIEAERIPEFRRGLSRTVDAMLSDQRREPSLEIDAYLPLADLSLDLVRDLERLAPFGPGNPPLLLVSTGLTVASQSAVGRSAEHLQLILEDGKGERYKVIWWQGAGWPLPIGKFDLVYVARASNFRGQPEVQVEWVEARPVEAPTIEVSPTPSIQVVDNRQLARPDFMLERLKQEGQLQVWREGDERVVVAGHDRNELSACQRLAVWTTPPGPHELAAALERVMPNTVYLFAANPPAQELPAFLNRLTGLVKYVLAKKEGRAHLASLAAAMATRESAVWLGIAWLQARGHIQVVSEAGDEVQLTAPGQAAEAESAWLTDQLTTLLDEIKAYRAHYARAAAAALINPPG